MVRSRLFVAFVGAVFVLSGQPALAQSPPVLVYAWPADSVLAHLKPGQEVPMRLGTNGNLTAITLSSAGMASYSYPSSQPRAALKVQARISGIVPRDNPTTCNTTFVKTLGKAWALVGQTYSTSRYINEYFDYSSGASSELGIGVSASGAFGTFTSAGTESTESTVEVTYPGQAGAKYTYFKSRFRLGKYKTVCRWRGGSATSYSSRVTNFSGGASLARPSSAPHTPSAYCDPYLNGSTFTLHKTHAIVWSNGLDTAGMIGIDLSASTGYSTDSRIQYTIHKNGATVCGTGGDAGGPHPYQVVGH